VELEVTVPSAAGEFWRQAPHGGGVRSLVELSESVVSSWRFVSAVVSGARPNFSTVLSLLLPL